MGRIVLSTIVCLICLLIIFVNFSNAELANSRIFNTGSQTILNIIDNILQDSNVPIESQDEKKGKVVCERLRIELDEFKRIGDIPSRGDTGGFKRPWLWARYRQQYQIQNVDNNHTKVTVKIHLEGYNAPGARWVTVNTNGTKEKEILDELQLRIEQKNS